MAEIEKQPLIESQRESTLEELKNRWQEAQASVQAATRDLISARQDYQRAWSRTPRGRVTLAVLVTLLICVFMLPIGGLLAVGMMDDEIPEEYLPRRVPLEAHIMSKCPDARDCLHDLVLPAMVNISRAVDFKLSYIGRNTNEDDGVLCMHGPSECLGNMIQLCAADLYPDPKLYLGFAMCMSRDYSEIPSEALIKDCALEHGIDFDRLNQCVSADDGQHAMSMLRDSVQRSADKNVNKSCTIRVDDKIWCVRDGGKWKDCESGHEVRDLVDEILGLRWKHTGEDV